MTVESEPKLFWIGAEVKKFSIWWSRSRNLKFWFRFHSPGLWGKQVNLLRGEHGLPYV